MEHHKSTEITHRLILKTADLLTLLNKPPRAVLVPTTAKVVCEDGHGDQIEGPNLQVTVQWVEKDK